MEGFMTDNRNIIVVKGDEDKFFKKKTSMPLHKCISYYWKDAASILTIIDNNLPKSLK
jgi:hypothetical protein